MYSKYSASSYERYNKLAQENAEPIRAAAYERVGNASVAAYFLFSILAPASVSPNDQKNLAQLGKGSHSVLFVKRSNESRSVSSISPYSFIGYLDLFGRKLMPPMVNGQGHDPLLQSTRP